MLEKRYDTRGHRYKLVPQLCKYDLQKHFFVNRLVKLLSDAGFSIALRTATLRYRETVSCGGDMINTS